MSTKYIQPGDIIDIVAGSALASDDVVVLVNRIAVVQNAIASGATGSVYVEGMFLLAKTTSQAWVQGDPLFWDPSTSKLTNVGTAAIIAGYAPIAAGSADTTGYVVLSPGYKQMPVQADTVAADLAALKVDFNLLLGKLKAAGSMANS